ncbi:MAG: hypothetical protein H7123_07480 [Thermoleophilia bacterium]|nr:hypothetical protein [Thermoleophilia bacterium]
MPPPFAPGLLPPPRVPSARGYVIGTIGMVLAALAVAYAIFAILSFIDDVNDFQRFKVPGTHTVHVSKPGTVDIFADVSSSQSNVPGLDDLVLTVTNPDGHGVIVQQPRTNETYDLNGRHGQLIARFPASKSGDYELVSRSTSPARVAVGRLALGSVVARAFSGFGAGALLGIGSLILLIVTGVRRGSAKRTRAALGLGAH